MLVQCPVPELSALRAPGRSWVHEAAVSHQVQTQGAGQGAAGGPSSAATGSIGEASPEGGAAAGHEAAGGAGPLRIGPGQAFAVPAEQGHCLELELLLACEEYRAAAAAAAHSLVGSSGMGSRDSSTAYGGQQHRSSGAQGLGSEVVVNPGGTTASDPAPVPGYPGRAPGGQPDGERAPEPNGGCSGFVLRTWLAGEGAAAVLYCWKTQVLEVSRAARVFVREES